jgi:hypothetical protein
LADSIREALTSAFSAAEQEAEDTNLSAPAPEPVSDPTPTTATAAPVGGGEPAVQSPGGDGRRPAAAPTAAKPAAASPPTGATPAERAPASWKAEEKAAWNTVPPAARAAIIRREQETQRVLSTTADARNLQRDFQQAIQPFMPLMEAHGVAPIPAIRALLEMRAQMEVGTKEQKAQLFSNLVRQFGVDIPALDGYLSQSHGQAPAAPPPRLDPRSIPELAPLFSLAEQVTTAQAAKLDSAFEPIESLPHYEAVRETMADLLEASAMRGKPLSLQKAYDVAVSMDSSLAGTPAATPPTTSEAAAILARSRKAASSVAGAPRTAPGTKPTDRRAQIEAAFDAVG